MTKMKLPKITEAEFMDQVANYAKLRGWKVAHFRPARTAKGYRTPCQYDAAGFPDLVMVRDGFLIFAELKRNSHDLEDKQRSWIKAMNEVMEACGSTVEVYVWTPEDWPIIEVVLR